MKLNKELIEQNIEHSEELCAKIRQEAEYQCQTLLARAKKEADTRIAEARGEAGRLTDEVRRESEAQIERLKERVFSTLNLGKKKILLEEKSAFADRVIESVKKEAERFRSSRDYPSFLKRAILEGARVIDQEHLTVLYAPADERTVDANFIREAEQLCRSTLNREFSLAAQKADFSDIGIIMQSADGRIVYDNRFAARLERMYEQVYMDLLRSSF